MIKGYKEVDIKDLSFELEAKKAEINKSDIDIASEIGVRSSSTISNAFRGIQMVSDEVLTKVMKSLDFKGLVVWDNGERKYFVSEK